MENGKKFLSATWRRKEFFMDLYPFSYYRGYMVAVLFIFRLQSV